MQDKNMSKRTIWKIILIGVILITAIITFIVVMNNKEKKHIVIVTKSDLDYWDYMIDGVEQAFTDTPVEIDVFMPNKEDVSSQMQKIEEAIDKGCDGIIVAPSDPVALENLIKKANKQLIPIVLVDTDAPKSERKAYIGTDNYSEGVYAGKEMNNLIGKGEVVIVTGSLIADNAVKRIAGFRDELSKDINVIQTINYMEKLEFQETVGQDLFEMNPNVDGIFAIYADIGENIAQEIDKNGLEDDVALICFDLDEKSLDSFEQGCIDLVIQQDPFMMGYEAAMVIKQGQSLLNIDEPIIKNIECRYIRNFKE